MSAAIDPTEDAAFDVLRAYLLRLAQDAASLDGWAALTDVVLSDQDVPRLGPPFAFIEILSAVDTGEADCHHTDADGVRTATRIFGWLLRVTVVGGSKPAPMDRLLAWKAALGGETVPELHPFTARDVTDPRRSIELVQTRSEPRAFMDLTLAAVVSRRQRIDVIEQVTVETSSRTVTETDTYERP
jgi:hypothetical protein